MHPETSQKIMTPNCSTRHYIEPDLSVLFIYTIIFWKELLKFKYNYKTFSEYLLFFKIDQTRKKQYCTVWIIYNIRHSCIPINKYVTVLSQIWHFCRFIGHVFLTAISKQFSWDTINFIKCRLNQLCVVSFYLNLFAYLLVSWWF